jgi:hypothetical protein
MKTQTGLIFKPEKPRVRQDEYLAQYLERQALVAGRVHAMSADAEIEGPWAELRDTLTNYPVRYQRGLAFQKRIAYDKLFKWQRPKPLVIVNTYFQQHFRGKK